MKFKSSLLAITAAFPLSVSTANAAILISSSPVTLNFNNLNTNFGGAYNSTGGTATFPTVTPGTAPITIYSGAGGTEFTVSNNDFSPGGVYSNTGTYSNSNSIRALRDAATSDLAIGVKDSGTRDFTLIMRNNTGSTVGAWNVDYLIEQYSKGASATTFGFSYSLNGTTFVTTNLSGGANVVANTTTPIDTNLSSVISTTRSAVITEEIANGADIYFRWKYTHIGGTSTHMGIDNITVTAVPEPQSAALLGGLGLLGLLRRRR